LTQTEGSDDIEPLEPDLWFRALERLSNRIVASDNNDVASTLRHAFHLVQLTPGPLKGVVRCELAESAYEQFLECGAFASAAAALIGSPMCYEVACGLRAGSRVIEAKAWLPGQTGRPAVVSGDSLSSALMGAWAACLVGLRRRSLAPEDSTLHQFPHKAPPAPRPKLTGH
jgi:hypothetical protein